MPDENKNKYAVTSWAGGTRDLEVPSGQMCLVRKSSVQALMAAGVIHDLDGLSKLVGTELVAPAEGKRPTKKALSEEDAAKSILADPKKFEDLMTLLDKVTCHVVLQPRIERTPNDVTRREDGHIYADMVDLEDKMAIFQYATGGIKELETFRDKRSQDVGGVDAQSEAGDTSE